MVEIEKVERVEVEEAQEEKKPTNKTKEQICKIKFAHGGFVYFIFEDATLREPQPASLKNKDAVLVTYSGTYGKSNFKIIKVE